MKVVPEAGAGEEQSRECLFVFVTLATDVTKFIRRWERGWGWVHVMGTFAWNSQVFKSQKKSSTSYVRLILPP